MKIEFKKVPNSKSPLTVWVEGAKLEGTFKKVSQFLVTVDASLSARIPIVCDRCTREDTIEIEENLNLTISNGAYLNNNEDTTIIEMSNGTIDFNYIIESELNSIKSDYHLCSICKNENNIIEQEF